MTQNVIVVLFGARAQQECRMLAMKRAKSGLPAFVLPAGETAEGETPAQAASRIAREMGCLVPPSSWKLAGHARADNTQVFTASLPGDAFFQLGANAKLRIDSAEMTMCDAWVNPRTYEVDFLHLLVLARSAY